MLLGTKLGIAWDYCVHYVLPLPPKSGIPHALRTSLANHNNVAAEHQVRDAAGRLLSKPHIELTTTALLVLRVIGALPTETPARARPAASMCLCGSTRALAFSALRVRFHPRLSLDSTLFTRDSFIPFVRCPGSLRTDVRRVARLTVFHSVLYEQRQWLPVWQVHPPTNMMWGQPWLQTTWVTTEYSCTCVHVWEPRGAILYTPPWGDVSGAARTLFRRWATLCIGW